IARNEGIRVTLRQEGRKSRLEIRRRADRLQNGEPVGDPVWNRAHRSQPLAETASRLDGRRNFGKRAVRTRVEVERHELGLTWIGESAECLVERFSNGIGHLRTSERRAKGAHYRAVRVDRFGVNAGPVMR